MKSPPSISTVPSPMMHGVAGALASTMSIVILYPIDQIRTLQQAASSSSQNGSILLSQLLSLKTLPSLYKGIGSSVEAMLVSYFVFFFTFAYFRRMKLKISGRSKPSPVDNLVSSIGAGILNVLITSPLWVYATNKRLGLGAAERGTSFVSFLMKTEKWTDLWKGTAASLWLVCNPVVHFVVYETGRLALLSQELNTVSSSNVGDDTPRVLTDRQALVLGGAAKFCATMATYPLQLVQTKLRAQGSSETGSTLGCLLDVYRRSGVIGCYSGLQAKLAQTVLNAMLMSVLYERILNLVHHNSSVVSAALKRYRAKLAE
ncbi:conserved hypothetical protein [Perkinsus marinus ATCC 50983]|uniref:Peroxisomal membrane protein pmp34 n=1 Tax=Perkinsus marinus (strain ATCC 50983 / TXsc) TaxID=423536 RepID=C5K486_PERM5|nr:conserved hypothetical protein [Perkinsus marinus ATCC 50983]EER20702.1 conserved hypothetical protein [Perkinsus marinus ATCC 50983]|eukprot:XP_002788906.1 conserved hypothetical protein [Perkinsus marinus ATCC 50983]